MKRLTAWLRQAGRSEDGSLAIELLVVLPPLMFVFMAAFESGLLMTRSIMLERAVDLTMRELRIGRLPGATHDSLKDTICSRVSVFPDCRNAILIEMRPVPTGTWSVPTAPTACVDRAEPIQPVTQMNTGGSGQMMVVRVCVVQDAIFPTSGIGLGLPLDGNGGYGVFASTAFVNEPS